MYVIGNVINSKRRRIRVAEFRVFCTDAMLHIKKHFEWKNIPDVVHEICAHVCDLIEENGGYGLGDLSEVCNFSFLFHDHIPKMSTVFVHNICKIECFLMCNIASLHCFLRIVLISYENKFFLLHRPGQPKWDFRLWIFHSAEN